MSKGLNRFFLVMCVALVLALSLGACGDGSSDEDPTDRLPNSGSIDKPRCKSACSKVGACFGQTDASSFISQCRLNCGRSGHFDTEALNCIDMVVDCEGIFDCGFEY